MGTFSDTHSEHPVQLFTNSPEGHFMRNAIFNFQLHATISPELELLQTLNPL